MALHDGLILVLWLGDGQLEDLEWHYLLTLLADEVNHAIIKPSSNGVAGVLGTLNLRLQLNHS